ncbi:MAG: F0F1 ATP synthase subunit delta [Pseudomonadota bacterium]
MSGSTAISTSIAMRYATAVFELAKENGNPEALEADIAALDTALNSSSDMRALIRSPVYTREEQAGAIMAIAKGLQLSDVFTNTLGLMASKRRLFILPALLEALSALLADEKDEITAEVVAAKAMTKSQQKKLAESLKTTVGKDVKISLDVDANLIGGLIVKVGSKMIDTSIRAKLANLRNAMKEVG